MSDTWQVRPASVTPTAEAVVTLMKGAVGAHVGVLYRADQAGGRRHLHLAWHHRLENESAAPPDSFWVLPRLDELELADLSTSARLIARRNKDGRVPYAFDVADSRFARNGALRLNRGYGLTCASLVVLLFAHARVELLDSMTWDTDRDSKRREEDEAAQRRLVEYLRRSPASASQADLVEQEIGCTRIRAEEVAAASGMSPRPVAFTRAEPQGRELLRVLF